jgi:ribose 5-phosphate isomerase A
MDRENRRMSLAKAAAGRLAASLVQDGMALGLGTGSTVAFFLEALAERMRGEGLRLRGVPTSLDTERRCRELGLPLAGLEELEHLDLTIDGADEIDPQFRLIKGGGGALLREKVVAQQSREVVIVVDPKKRVARLGTTFALPVEVVPFALAPVLRAVRALGANPVQRGAHALPPYRTDNGNAVLDLSFPDGIADPEALEQRLKSIAGVVEVGLFIGLAHGVIVGFEDGRAEYEPRRGPV